MNLHFIVEGETERLVYPSWLRFLCQHLKPVEFVADAIKDNYCIQSGIGYPQIFNYLGMAIEDLNDLGNFDFLVVCIDAEEKSIEERLAEVWREVGNHKPRGFEVIVIIQNPCIETWFLGNRKALSRNPQGSLMKSYLSSYDVSLLDPEKMPSFNQEMNVAQFHEKYLTEMLREHLVSESQRGIAYQKERPVMVMEEHYLHQLILRTQETDHLQSLRNFLDFCDKVNS